MGSVCRRASVVLGLVAAGAVASPMIAVGAQAVHPVAGAAYVGNSGKCAPSIQKQCVFKFRVSSDGHRLRYVKKGKAISLWECQGGGGEAVFGTGTNDYAIPTAQIHSDGTFSGRDGSGSRLLRVTGRFTGVGKTATLKFVLPNQHCRTPKLTLKKK